MSYDFKLFATKADEDPLATARLDTDTVFASPPEMGKEARKRKIAEALITFNPALEIFQFGYDEIAKSMKISLEEARLRFRHLELNDPVDGNGIQIILFDEEASLTVPYWHMGDKATAVFRQIWSYLEIIHQQTGYLVYDPQIERVFDPSSNFKDAMEHYEKVVKSIKQIPQANTRNAWWKFW